MERRVEISRPGTMIRKFDLSAQRQIWVPSRANKRSRKEIAEIDRELLNRSNRFDGGYQPHGKRLEEYPPQEETEEIEPESEGESQRIRGDTLRIVDLMSYNTGRKERNSYKSIQR